MACLKLLTVFFVYFSVCNIKTLAQDVEPSCNDRWSLDYELDDGDGSVPEVLNTLTEKTFKNYTINIKDCEGDGEYEYTIDAQYIWDLRYYLYNDTYETIVSCRDCANTLDSFRTCMADVRNTMTTRLLSWDSEIQAHLDGIKEEAEKDCVVVS